MKNLTTILQKSPIKTVFCCFFYITPPLLTLNYHHLRNQNLSKHPKNTFKSPISLLINLLKDSPHQPKTPISPIWQILCQIAKFPQETFL